jgi:hypothetical protein
MAANAASQKLAFTDDTASQSTSFVVGQALDRDPEAMLVISGRPQFTATSDATSVAADTVVFDFPSATITGLNLAAGESRVLKARVQSSGTTMVACSFFESTVIVMNVAGTLTMNAVLNNLYNAAGVVTLTVLWAVNAGAVRFTVTVPATIPAGTNYRCDLTYDGPKAK